MNDYELLEAIQSNLPHEYSELTKYAFKRYTMHVANDGSIEDEKSKGLFKQYFEFYYICLNQKKNKYFTLQELREVSYSQYREKAEKIYEGLKNKK